jgi:hypothetical protein
MTEQLTRGGSLPWLLAGAAALAVALLAIVALRRKKRKSTTAPGASMRTDDSVPEEAVLAAVGESVVTREAQPPPRRLETALADALDSGDPQQLAGAYLDLARRRTADGETEDAHELLLKCVRVASASGQKETHARARVELGEIAYAAGDLTTACEHWQIARKLFHETELTREHEIVEARMLANGCPTDWVLTDF